LVYNEEEFLPLQAKYAGIIKEINIITGTINVKVGDYVNAGDILVLPFNVSSRGEKVSVKPLAEIKAEIYVVGKAEMNKIEKRLVRSGATTTTYNYMFKNKKLFSSNNKNSFALFETVVYNENISDVLPLYRDVCVHYELIETEVVNDFNIEKQGLIDKSVNLAYELLPVGKVLNELTTTNIINERMIAVTTIIIYGNIT
jgi:hypothetical protein